MTGKLIKDSSSKALVVSWSIRKQVLVGASILAAYAATVFLYSLVTRGWVFWNLAFLTGFAFLIAFLFIEFRFVMTPFLDKEDAEVLRLEKSRDGWRPK